VRRLLPLILLLAACTTEREWKNVASTITVGAGAYDGGIDAGNKRGLDSYGTQVFVSFRPLANWEQPKQVIVVQPSAPEPTPPSIPK
jgi:hypothetical protein